MLDSLKKIVSVLDSLKLDYMVIGGWALPVYGIPRTTQDVDFAVAVNATEQLETLLEALAAKQLLLETSKPSIDQPLFVVLDHEFMVYVEFYLRPDGIEFDHETLSRRLKRSLDGFAFYVPAPEDFITTKLARPDRSVDDERDVMGVLKRQENKLDRNYLYHRASRARVLGILQALEDRIKETAG